MHLALNTRYAAKDKQEESLDTHATSIAPTGAPSPRLTVLRS
jgi:hypothetical protein